MAFFNSKTFADQSALCSLLGTLISVWDVPALIVSGPAGTLKLGQWPISSGCFPAVSHPLPDPLICLASSLLL